jgi:tetratricopeptide (TPR) repeat protein
VDNPRNAEAHERLGRLYFSTQQLDKSAKHTATAAEQNRALLLPLAHIRLLQNDRSSAKRIAEKAREQYSRLAQSNQGNVEARMLWADAEAFLGRPSEAERVLLEGLRQEGNQRYRSALVQLYVRCFDARTQSGEASMAELVQLLERARRYGPSDHAVFHRVAWLASRGGKDTEKLRSALNEVLVSGKAPPTVHLILGTIAADQGDYATALLHLEEAHRLQPKMPDVMNNLAWVLANSDPPQLSRALELANTAVEINPAHPEIRHTRGRILFKLGRYREALGDLEAALSAERDDGELHRTLATVYEKLGDSDLAAEHRRAADAAEASDK